MGQSFHSSMSSIFDSKGSVLPYSQGGCLWVNPSRLLPYTDHRDADPCRLWLPGLQVSSAKGQHWQGTEGHEEGKSQDISHLLSLPQGASQQGIHLLHGSSSHQTRPPGLLGDPAPNSSNTHPLSDFPV